ncbi:MAG TPA: L-histidine N(alpha)-methyltransferase, partial [Gammaproteobacteria bacterium]|nr:L-histidine N(alpha)-methyltransferase [Gammaproteobacteria bacterium]
RRIPPKYFYDARGSRLFEAICEQPEYYPTRTEAGLLSRHAGDIAALAENDCCLIEPGSGSCDKVRLLLGNLRPAVYVPIDISCDHLQLAAECVARDFPWLEVHAVCTDITETVSLPIVARHARRVVFYPGSSIGNFEPAAATAFLRDLAGVAGPGGAVLIGVDLRKDDAVLNAAYNDAAGLTASFNLNLLRRINRELHADFSLDNFEHFAFYNRSAGRIEMHLVSRCRQTVRIDGRRFEFRAGEHIHTENSYKYTVQGFQMLAVMAGLNPVTVWIDRDKLFSLHYLQRAD